MLCLSPLHQQRPRSIAKRLLACYRFQKVGTVFAQVQEFLPLAKEQPNDSKRYGDLENVTTFGVAAKRMRDNDEKLHTNQVLRAVCGLSSSSDL